MSYDVYFAGQGHGQLDENYTYNVAPMFFSAVGEGPNQWGGKSAREVRDVCARILAAFDADPDKYRAMNPENGWGDFDGARRFIQKIHDACKAHPRRIVRVS